MLLAYEVNGEPISAERGGPVRAIVPGWYATDSVKWLDRVWFTAGEFDGVFQAHDYRFRPPGAPGSGRRMTELPVHALIISPTDGEERPAGSDARIRGTAWGGTGGIAQVLVRLDLGPWTQARITHPRGRYSLTAWELACPLDAGVHEVACRAVDQAGHAQPDRPAANVRGYANNAVHRVRFRAA